MYNPNTPDTNCNSIIIILNEKWCLADFFGLLVYKLNLISKSEKKVIRKKI